MNAADKRAKELKAKLVEINATAIRRGGMSEDAWQEVFSIEDQLKSLGKLEYATYDAD